MNSVTALPRGVHFDQGINFQSVGNGVRSTFKLSAYTVTHSDALERVVKITARMIDLWLNAAKVVSVPLENLTHELRDTAFIFESLKIFGTLPQLTVKDSKGKNILVSKEVTWQRKFDKVTLNIHNTFKAYRGLHKMGFAELGAMAKHAIGHLPIFTLTMDAFILLSSIFGTWDSLVDKRTGLPATSKAIEHADRKLMKWESRPEEIKNLRNGDEGQRLAFEERFLAKADNIRDDIFKVQRELRLAEYTFQMANDPASGGFTDEERAQIQATHPTKIEEIYAKLLKLYSKQEKNDYRLALIAADDTLGLAAELSRTQIDGEHGKIRKWEVMKHNARIPDNRHWLRIASNIGKIAIVSWALICTAMNAWSLPFLMSILVLGSVSDAIGLTKIYYDHFAKPLPVPKTYHFAA